MAKLPITIACGDYDRVRAIRDGRVPVEGCEVTFLALEPEELFFRAFRHGEFDVTEMSAGSYISAVAREDAAYVAIPVFPSRMFRHSSIYIRTDRGIASPKDLKGKLVGTPEYQLTAILWARGILDDEYGIKPQDLKWRTGGLHEAGRIEKTVTRLPPGIDIAPIDADETLDRLLEAGRIDAVIAPRPPRCFERKAPHVGRLFADSRGAERDYYKKTGMFPIMHMLGIKRELAEAHPWLANSLYNAFLEAKEMAFAKMRLYAALPVALPWFVDELDATVELMGRDFWSYGVEPNRKTLAAMARYAFEHGPAVREVSVDELFVKSTLERFKI
ncbi:MAG TPA: PhnD/SsuA/transferrin family substrate-binding protein [Alphaproteobacteria bacterium]|nr:PhnD/SsuA/transferrin family substrate-binding protein [Alphaproteobacteria bacterium]